MVLPRVMETIAFLVILGAAISLFVSQFVRIEVTSVLLISALSLSGILSPEEAFSGFANQAFVTVAAMFVLSRGLMRSGALRVVTDMVVRAARGSRIRLMASLGSFVSVTSAFMNNTPLVAFMIPVALSLSRRFNVRPSKLLIPISYFSILGGTCTLIGTSTSILVHSLYQQAGGPGFALFEFTGLGIIYVLVGGTLVCLMSGTLPERTSLTELLSSRRGGSFMTEVVVRKKGPARDRTIEKLFRGPETVRPIELIRNDDVILAPDGSMAVEPGDTILVEGTANAISQLMARGEVEYGSAVADGERVTLRDVVSRLTEAIVAPGSRFLGQRLNEIGLAKDYGIYVLGVRRLGQHHHEKLRRMRLMCGDVLLLQGTVDALRRLDDTEDVLLVEGVEETLTTPGKAPLSLAIMVSVLVLAGMGVAPISVVSLAGATLMVLTRCLDTRDAISSLDSSVLFLLAGTIPLGLAMEKTGLASSIANSLVQLSEPLGAIAVVSALYFLTSVLTEVLSNNAVAVLLTPIALGMAARMGIDPKPLLIAVTFGASASFATPIGYQTNALVMGPGGYTFRDYLRIGLPLNFILWITATALIPVFWPL